VVRGRIEPISKSLLDLSSPSLSYVTHQLMPHSFSALFMYAFYAPYQPSEADAPVLLTPDIHSITTLTVAIGLSSAPPCPV
jgi:hypothetical protein